jgi:hypothetical protein
MNRWAESPANANKLRQTYFNGFIDISGGGIYMRNDMLLNFFSNNDANPKFSVNSDHMFLYDKTTDALVDVSTSQLIYLKNLTQDVQQSLYQLSNDPTFNGTVTILGDASIQSRLFVNNDVTISGNLYTNYPASTIPQSAIIGDVGTFIATNEDIEYDEDNFAIVRASHAPVILSSDINIGGLLKTTGNVLFEENLVVNQNLVVHGDISSNGNLYINFPMNSIPSSAIIGGAGGNVYITGGERVYFDAESFALVENTYGETYISNNINIDGTLNVNGNISIGGNNNITLGSGSVLPTFSQLGYTQTTYLTSTQLSSSHLHVLGSTMIPAGTYIVSWSAPVYVNSASLTMSSLMIGLSATSSSFNTNYLSTITPPTSPTGSYNLANGSQATVIVNIQATTWYILALATISGAGSAFGGNYENSSAGYISYTRIA